jgi:hypothetical protein
VISPSNDFEFRETTLDKFELCIGSAKKFERIDIGQNDFFLCQALIPLLISF